MNGCMLVYVCMMHVWEWKRRMKAVELIESNRVAFEVQEKQIECVVFALMSRRSDRFRCVGPLFLCTSYVCSLFYVGA